MNELKRQQIRVKLKTAMSLLSEARLLVVEEVPNAKEYEEVAKKIDESHACVWFMVQYAELAAGNAADFLEELIEPGSKKVGPIKSIARSGPKRVQ